jgi:hypothetical protein
MFKLIDPQNISKRSFLSHKTFTVTHATSGSYGNFVVQALSGSKHNYTSGSDLVTHIVSGSGTSGEVSSSYYAKPTYFVLNQLHYDNKLNSFETNRYTKRELHQSSSIFSIPRNLYGERIKKGSVKLSDISNGITFDIRDDEDGNLYDFAFSGSYAAYKSSSYDRTQGIDSVGSGSQIGNVFYEQGLLVITDTGSYSQVGRGTSYSLEFQATQRHYEYEYVCTANQYEFNNTMNISATAGRSGSISMTSGPEKVVSTLEGAPITDRDGRIRIDLDKSLYRLFPPGSSPKGELVRTAWSSGVIAGHGSSTMGEWSTDGTATVRSGSGTELILSASTGPGSTVVAKAFQSISVKKGKDYVFSGDYNINTTNSGTGKALISDDGYLSNNYRVTSEPLYNLEYSSVPGTSRHFSLPFRATQDTHHIGLIMEDNSEDDAVSWENISIKEWHGFDSGIGDYESSYKAGDTYNNFVTHSEFRPYVTQIGLYDDHHQLLAIAKLGTPIKLDDQYDTSFVVRFDV